MIKICPVSVKNINANLSRFNAGFTVIMSVFYLFTNHLVLILVVLMDFILRNIREGKLNPFTRFNNYLIEVIQIPDHIINAGPKIFAARMGLILSLSGTIAFFFGNPEFSFIFVGVLSLFSFLEAAFNYCVACKLYPFLLPLNRLFEKS